MAHAFDPSARETEEVEYLWVSRPVWSTKQIPGEPGLLHREYFSQKTKTKTKSQNNHWICITLIITSISQLSNSQEKTLIMTLEFSSLTLYMICQYVLMVTKEVLKNNRNN